MSKTKPPSPSAFISRRAVIGLLLCLGGVTLALFAFRSASAQSSSQPTPVRGIYRGLSPVVHFDISPPLRDIKPIPPGPGQLRENEDQDIVPRNFYFGFEPDPVVQSKAGTGWRFLGPSSVLMGQATVATFRRLIPTVRS